ncbi:MAG TPA: glycerol-3-phosphate 1-O-acyltransferase PlsY [Terriglobales bacterium]|nr:glycerol-3-phosphate 1-O-acyltransferase PlsY [Terriglobales bacterium]
MPVFLTAALSYLLGSIPFGYLLVRGFRGTDVRETGSGNIGATNVSRTSPVLGVATLLLDASKGTAAVFLARSVFHGDEKLVGLAALFAILGHMLPVWLRFRGGKGVATGIGAFLPIAPKAVLVGMAVFLVVFLLLRFVSLASIAMFAVIPLAARSFGVAAPTFIFLVTATVLIVLKHHENIHRLWNGSESRWGRG